MHFASLVRMYVCNLTTHLSALCLGKRYLTPLLLGLPTQSTGDYSSSILSDALAIRPLRRWVDLIGLVDDGVNDGGSESTVRMVRLRMLLVVM